MTTCLALSDFDLPGFFTPRVFESLDGSNAEAKRQAGAGAQEGLLVVTAEQLAGRGRRGRQWASPKGNLYCSILLRPRGKADLAALTSFVAALAVADLVQSYPPGEAKAGLKWPNDVLLGGKKVSGILLESTAASENQLDWLVVGMGVNLRHFPEDTETPATSILAESGTAPTVAAAAKLLAERFLHWLMVYRDDGFEPIRRAWLARAIGVGGDIRVRLPNETLIGRFKGLDADGALALETKGKIRRITAGEVFFNVS